MTATVEVEREDVRIMFVRAPDDTQAAIQRAWAEFEEAVGLKGRKFFGTFDHQAQEYRVCVQLKDGDDPQALGFEVGTLPGGIYLRARLQGEPQAVYEQIRPALQEMEERAALDPSRPTIEFYRSRDVIDLLLPIV